MVRKRNILSGIALFGLLILLFLFLILFLLLVLLAPCPRHVVEE